MSIEKIDKEAAEETTRLLIHNIEMYNGAWDEDFDGRADSLQDLENTLQTLKAIIEVPSDENARNSVGKKTNIEFEDS